MSSLRRPGRPRDDSADDKILAAALARLERDGYEHLRVDDVAADAGVAKTTLYRRWESKEALVAEVMRRLYLDRVPAVDHGDLRADLVALVGETYRLLFEGPGQVVEDLVRSSGASRELADVVRATTQARRRAFHQAMNRAVARGELDPAADHDLVIDLLVGPLWTRLLVSDLTMSPDDVETIVDAVLDGVALPNAAPPP
ncbi:MAG TPA: TetR/AcrR family transcriptional regulator [Acidimicrobiales bacterium]|nr:TetR/AcrR family transcriptional regulator [Acidimicrobiales bacterium]